MNQTQINNFLMCLERIDDINYLNLHERAAAFNDFSSISGAHDDHEHEHVHVHEDETSDSHDLLIAKITAMVVLFCATSICGSIPFMLNRCFKWTENNANARSATVVKCLLYFGGGVLLCTTFMHLLPEVEEVVEQLQECNIIPKLAFALPQLLMCCGFLLMYLVEEVIHTAVHRNKHIMEKDHGAGAAFERGHSVRKSYLVKGGAKSASDDDLVQSADESTNTCNGTISQQDLISNDAENQKYQTQVAPVEHSEHTTNEHNRRQHHDYQQQDSCEHGHSHLPISSGGDDDMVTSSLRGLFIVLALSLHELFEGMAIGLEGTASAVWFMFGAVSAHKLVLAFCVGVELIVARTRPALSFVYVFTFAVVSPIGIGVGILISHNSDASGPSIPSAILQGLACGTLLYVVFFEILSKHHAGLIAYLSLFVGFGIMFGLQQLDHDHDHGHGHCGGEGHSHDSSTTTDITTTDAAAGAVKQQLSFEEQLQILRQASKHILENSKKTN